MPTKRYSNERHCLTCQYWMGQRERDRSDERRCICESDQTKGRCSQKLNHDAEKLARFSCGKWEKWSCLQ